VLYIIPRKIIEILITASQILGEFLLQLVFEALLELGCHGVKESFRRPAPNPWLAAVGYFVFGAVAGWVSLWVWPASFMLSPAARLVNFVVTPVVLGGVMALLGAWRRRRGEEVFRIDRFFYGYLLALGMAAVRFRFTSG
jgi:hypothetical protein